jgi:FkbM family methyltransferase
MGTTLEQGAVDELLCFVDVGSRGGLQAKWHPHADAIRAIMFEPDPEEAARLRDQIGPNSRHMVFDHGLSNLVGRQKLYVTVNSLDSSLLPPNAEFLANYEIRPHFELERQAEVDCTRYDVLYYEGKVPSPDAIKIDVQGFEFQVLEGFGSLLQHCLGIELEAHFYPLYREQKLLHEIIGMLRDYGLMLRTLQLVGQFDGDLVEVNAFFTKSRHAVRSLSPPQRRKFDLLTKVWELPVYRP